MENHSSARPLCDIKWLRLFVLAVAMLVAAVAQPQTVLTIVDNGSQALLNNLSVVSLSDFNLTGSGSAATLFRVTISASSPTEVTMSFDFESTKYSTFIIRAKTNPFLLSGFRTFTNRDFGSGTSFADVTMDYLDFNTDLVNELQRAILSTGRLPNDTYIFHLRLAGAGGQGNVVPDDVTLTIDITNPTRLTLVSPGSEAGRADCYELYTTLPLFQWDSNVDRFVFTICEQLRTNSSPEDVMQNQPRVQATLRRDVDFFGKPSFLYPASGVLPLSEGRTYYWQVLGILDSPSGEIRLPSEIWCFRIGALGSAGVDLANQQLLSLLAGILGQGEINALFGSGGALEGFRPNGVMTVDGQRVDLSGLTEILNQLRNGSRQLQGFTVE